MVCLEGSRYTPEKKLEWIKANSPFLTGGTSSPSASSLMIVPETGEELKSSKAKRREALLRRLDFLAEGSLLLLSSSVGRLVPLRDRGCGRNGSGDRMGGVGGETVLSPAGEEVNSGDNLEAGEDCVEDEEDDGQGLTREDRACCCCCCCC